jgi:hypothetical protein
MKNIGLPKLDDGFRWRIFTPEHCLPRLRLEQKKVIWWKPVAESLISSGVCPTWEDEVRRAAKRCLKEWSENRVYNGVIE